MCAAESWACGGLGSALMWFCQGSLRPACLVSWVVQNTWHETRHRPKLQDGAIPHLSTNAQAQRTCHPCDTLLVHLWWTFGGSVGYLHASLAPSSVPCSCPASMQSMQYGSQALAMAPAAGIHSWLAAQIDCESRTVLRIVQLHEAAVNALAVHERAYFSAADDGQLRMWPADFSHISLEASHTAPVTAVCSLTKCMCACLQNLCVGRSGLHRDHSAPWGSPTAPMAGK